MSYISKMFDSWIQQDVDAAISLLEKSDSMLDVGCGNGELTERFATTTTSRTVVGIDTIGTNKNFSIIKADINRELPLQDASFDSVISHYSLEHAYNTGLFISETHRVLKPGGYTVVATDNLSSWPNIFSLLLGFQPFSSTNGIGKRAIGNPFALRAGGYDAKDSPLDTEWRSSGEYAHNKVLAYRALLDAYTEYGFHIEKIIGIGYFPFTGRVSALLANIDTRHAHFLILKARKVA